MLIELNAILKNLNSTFSSLMTKIIFFLFGLIIFQVALMINYSTESDILKSRFSLALAKKIVINAPVSPVDPKNNLQLIHIAGIATTHDTLHDDLLNYAKPTLYLSRRVEIYEWVETRNSDGGYTYTKVWKDTLFHSNFFAKKTGHENPDKIPLMSAQFDAQVNMGDFIVPPTLIHKLTPLTPINIHEINVTKLNIAERKVSYHDNEIYIGNNPDQPAVGDLRISFNEIKSGQVMSIVGQQINNTLQAYPIKNGDPVFIIKLGEVGAEKMLTAATPVTGSNIDLMRRLTFFLFIISLLFICNSLSFWFTFFQRFILGVASGILIWGGDILLIRLSFYRSWTLILFTIVVIVAYLIYFFMPNKTT